MVQQLGKGRLHVEAPCWSCGCTAEGSAPRWCLRHSDSGPLVEGTSATTNVWSVFCCVLEMRAGVSTRASYGLNDWRLETMPAGVPPASCGWTV